MRINFYLRFRTNVLILNIGVIFVIFKKSKLLNFLLILTNCTFLAGPFFSPTFSKVKESFSYTQSTQWKMLRHICYILKYNNKNCFFEYSTQSEVYYSLLLYTFHQLSIRNNLVIKLCFYCNVYLLWNLHPFIIFVFRNCSGPTCNFLSLHCKYNERAES